MPKRPYHYHHGTKQYFFQNSFLFKLNFEYTKSGVPEDLDWCWTNVEKIKEESSITLIYLPISMFPGAGVSVLTKQLPKGNIGESGGGGEVFFKETHLDLKYKVFFFFLFFLEGGISTTYQGEACQRLFPLIVVLMRRQRLHTSD